MKYIFISFLSLLFCQTSFAQNSIGMTIGRYYNWGTSYSFKEVQQANPGWSGLDSAVLSDVVLNSSTMQTGFTVGGQYRFLSADSTNFAGRWSKNIALNIGYLQATDLTGASHAVYNINAPYTTIFQGDTTTTLVDSMFENLHFVKSTGYLAQVGFGLHHIIRTETRVQGELGFGVKAGFGALNATYTNIRYYSYVEDSTETYSSIPYTKQTYDQTLKREHIFSGQVELTGGLFIPLAKDDNTWWISIHASFGIGAIHLYNTWLPRMTFVPTFGIHFQLPGEQTDTDGYK